MIPQHLWENSSVPSKVFGQSLSLIKGPCDHPNCKLSHDITPSCTSWAFDMFFNVSTSPSFREHRSSKVSMPWFSTIALSYLWKNSSIPSKVFGKSLYVEIIQGILALVLHHSIKGLWPISLIGEIIQGIHALVLHHTIKGLWPISLMGRSS